MRARWIALVMDSIYPDGVIWERLQIETAATTLPAQPHNADPGYSRISADNRASIVFALGIAMAIKSFAGLVLVLSHCLSA